MILAFRAKASSLLITKTHKLIKVKYFCTRNEMLPALPKNYLFAFGLNVQKAITEQMTIIEEESSLEEGANDVLYKTIKKINAQTNQITLMTKNGLVDEVTALIAENEADVNKVLGLINNDPVKREQKLAFCIEKFTVARLFRHFFSHGRIAPQETLQPCTDEEYIGAVLTLAQDISRYVLGRACEGDVGSIDLSRSLVTELHGKMLEFDFRNGPLRRKYDGLKYAVKNIEDISFELSLLSDAPFTSGTEGAANAAADITLSTEPATKRSRVEDDNSSTSGSVSGMAAQAMSDVTITNSTDNSAEMDTTSTDISAKIVSFLDSAEMDLVRGRMDNYDKLRELVIKDSRDVQKLAKQSIFAVLRGQTSEARNKLAQAEKCILKIMETINAFPTLRNGAFSNSLEEWAEGKLTLEWVENKRVLSRAEMAPINTYEYIGALSDFTGEIGRLAVMSASKRDLESVREIHQVDVVLATAIAQINSGGRYTKKLEAINTNLRKVEDVIYELSMLQRSGRKMRTNADLSAAPAGSGTGKAEGEEE